MPQSIILNPGASNLQVVDHSYFVLTLNNTNMWFSLAHSDYVVLHILNASSQLNKKHNDT